MKKTFIGYYQPSEEEFRELWNKCLFVIDANILLNLYRYPKEAQIDLLRVLEQISTRLWIPHQAALEYQENRLGVIAEQKKRFDEVKKILKSNIDSLSGQLDGLQLKKRHSAIDPDGFIERIKSEASAFEKVLSESEKTFPDVFKQDAIRDLIDKLLEGKVGEPYTADRLDKIYELGKDRYEKKHPPGYEDRDKGKDEKSFYTNNGVRILREYGDLIYWFQIIEKASNENIEYMVLITDDRKEDWWWIFKSSGKKTIGPRPELIEEIMKESGIKMFYMYNPERFLEYAKQHFDLKIEQESIRQVKEISELRSNETKSQSLRALFYHIERAVADWLKNNSTDYDTICSERYGRGVDIISVNDKTNHRVGYEIKFSRNNTQQFFSIIHNIRQTSRILFEKDNLVELKYVIVFEDEDAAKKLMSKIAGKVKEYEMLLLNVSFVIGFIEPNDESERSRYRFVSIYGH